MERMARTETPHSGASQGADKKGQGGQLDGKLLRELKKFKGGEEEWTEWSEDFKMIIEMRCQKVAKLMKYVELHGEMSTEKAVNGVVEEDVEEYQTDYTNMSTLSCELYRWLVLTTEEGSEPRLLIKSAGDHDGIAAWGRVHTKYKRRTITT